MQGGDKSIGQKGRSTIRWSLLALHLCLAIHLFVRVGPIAGVGLAALAVNHLPLESRFLRQLVFVFVSIVSILPLLACAMAIYWLWWRHMDKPMKSPEALASKSHAPPRQKCHGSL